MLFQHQQQQQRQHEFQHLKTHLFPQWQSDSSNNPLIQTPTATTGAAQTLPQPVKKRSYTTAGGRGGGGASRAALRNAGGVGEIVEVQGGHILRSTGRKDRHSKVCTAKGPRDRRVRLSANTAIQFYDVQDRLGYDRPSKAVDWLMKKAKAAIDELDELPAWKPSATKPKSPAVADSPSAGVYNNDNGSGGLLPPSLESDAIADTIKSFFPLNGAVSEAQSTQFEPYPSTSNHHNSSSSGSQDLKLSLQSFQDPMLIGFDNPSSGWGGGGGFMVIPPPQAAAAQQQALLFHHQRGPLQSSNTPNPVRAWIGGDYSIGSSSHDFHQAVSFSGIGAGFSGYCFPARTQGEDEEEHAGIPVKPSSASSASRH